MKDQLNRFGSSAGHSRLVVFILCAATAVVVALPSLFNGFVYDDVWILERNEVVHELDFEQLLSSPFWPEDRGDVMWRPVALTAFALQWVLGGGTPLVFHAWSVLLYGAVSGLAGLLCASLFGPHLGLVAGLLFAVHPVHVEVTANVVGQAELWAALGYIGALLTIWERSRPSTTGKRLALLLVMLGFLLVGLGGKEQPVTLPGAILVVWWLRARTDSMRLLAVARREWAVLATTCGVIAGFLLLRADLGGGVTAAGGIATGLDPDSVLSRIVVMLPVTLTWLRVLFVPVALSADYSPLHLVPELRFGPNHAIAILLWGSLLTLTVLVRDRLRALFVGALLFLVTISVVSNVVVPLEVLMAERLMFLPSLGWAIAVAGVICYAWEKLSTSAHRRALLVFVGAVAVLFAGRSFLRARVWRSNDAFFASLMEDAPASFRTHWARGHFAFEQGDSARGERDWMTAVRLNPEHPQLLEDFGRLYAATGRYEPAIPLLGHAVEIDSARLSSALPLALALSRSGRNEEALAVLNSMTALHGETRGLLLVRGEVLMRSGDFDGAYGALAALIQREPEAWSVRLMAADAALQAGLCDVALAQADTALLQAPGIEKPGIESFRARVANSNANCK